MSTSPACWSLIAVLATAAPAARGAEDPPGNILILLADDMGVDQVEAYAEGATMPATPTLNGLAAEGVLFRNCWSNPTCSPTRATLLTGRYAMRTGIGIVITPNGPSLADEEITLPEMLDLGTGGAWANAAFGKWHVSTDWIDPETGSLADPASGGLLNPNLQGWSWYEGSFHGLNCPQSLCGQLWWQGPQPFDYFNWQKVRNGVAEMSSTYETTSNVDAALAWIQEAPEPWICYLAFTAPHDPWQAPPAGLSSSNLPPGSKPMGSESARPYYVAMVEALDTEIGRLFTELDTFDPTLRDRTTTIFAGDNGTHANVTVPPFIPQHAKGTVYEGGVNVPLIVTGPLVTAPGSKCRGLVNLTDLFATVADIAGVDLETTLPDVPLDSVSFVPYLSDPSQPSLRPFAFTEQFRPNERLPLCQVDLGLGGPGDAYLSICGDPLFAGNSSDFTLTGVAPGAFTWIIASTTYNPVPLFFGTLGPFPILLLLGPVPSANDGTISFPVPGGTPAGEGVHLYFQTATQDASQPAGYALSNTVHARWPEQDELYAVVAIRNTLGTKLIRVITANGSFTPLAYGGATELLFDLRNDPFEQVNLLEQPLSAFFQSGYEQLSAELDALLASR